MLALGACGKTEGSQPDVAKASSHAAEIKLPEPDDLARRMSNAFRLKLRQLSFVMGASGESGDLGQPVPTGLVDRVSCTEGDRADAGCTVIWSDLRGRPHRTTYTVVAARECFSATAKPALAALYDTTEGTYLTHPLQELAGVDPC